MCVAELFRRVLNRRHFEFSPLFFQGLLLPAKKTNAFRWRRALIRSHAVLTGFA